MGNYNNKYFYELGKAEKIEEALLDELSNETLGIRVFSKKIRSRVIEYDILDAFDSSLIWKCVVYNPGPNATEK